MHKVPVNRLEGLSLPRKSVVRLTDRPDMTLDVYRGRKTTIQYNHFHKWEQVQCIVISYLFKLFMCIDRIDNNYTSDKQIENERKCMALY